MSQHNLRPDAIGNYDAWTLGAGATKVAAVDPGNPIAHNDDTDYILMASGSGVASQSFSLELPTFTSLALNAVNYGVRSKVHWLFAQESLFVFARMNGVDGTSVPLVHTVTNVYISFSGALPRPGGGQWAWADLFNGSLEVGISNPAAIDGEARVTSLWLVPDGVESPQQIDQARDTLSRHLWLFLGEIPTFKTTAPLKAMDLELYDEVAVSDQALPLQHALGDRSEKWARPLFRLCEEETNLNLDPGTEGSVALTLKDIRRELVTFVDMGQSAITGGRTADGVLRFDVGCTRQWTRGSKAWVGDPSDGIIRELQDNYEKMGPDGMLFERASTNGFNRTSFVQQLTGWSTLTGVTAEVAADNLPLFETTVTGFVAKITSDTGGDRGPLSPNSVSYTANTIVSLSVDYREGEASTGLKIRITRSFDGRYWDGAAWQVAVQNLAVTATTGHGRALFENIDVGANATRVRVQPVIPAVAGKTAYIYHIQNEAQRWASESRIVVDSAASYARVIDSLAISNNTGARCWNNLRGSTVYEYIRKWGTAASGDLFYFEDLPYDANNRFRFFYQNSTTELILEAKRGGVTSQAKKLWVPTRDVAARVGYRWISSDGELGLPPYTLSVFAEGVKGTDAVSDGGMPVEAASSSLYIGVDNTGLWSADGVVRRIIKSQLVYTDAEMARGGP